MTTNRYGELVLTKAEYKLLREALEAQGVALNWSSSDGITYSTYIRNPYKEACDGWGSDLVKNQAKEFFARYNK